MVSFKEKHGLLFRPRLKRLQETQAEIFRQLLLLIPEGVTFYDSFQSRVAGSPLLRMDILERHPYTHFLRLTYQFKDGESHEIAPDAHIRMYHDARLAEVTSFNPPGIRSNNYSSVRGVRTSPWTNGWATCYTRDTVLYQCSRPAIKSAESTQNLSPRQPVLFKFNRV